MLEHSVVSLLAALDTTALWWWIDVIVKVSLGLGAVIFVHELGHFLVAKACGVKCEKFMIGFDIGGYKIARKWGETVYGIGILPLGGYVKMLGQDDDPGHIAEQMQKSQIDSHSADAVPITGPNGEKYYVDRRSYLAKSVPQRMAIISAGVIMNIIFAFIFAVIAYGMGVPYQPSIVSETMPGSPAWSAGIEPGDEIIKLGEVVDPTFMQLRGGVMLGELKEGIPCTIRRASDGKQVSLTLKPQQDEGLAKIGVVPPSTVIVYADQPTVKDSAAAQAKFVALSGEATGVDSATGKLAFKGGRIVRVNDTEIKDYRDWQAALAAHPDKALLITVRRIVEPAKGATAEDSNQPPLALDMQFEVPVAEMRQFGLVMKMGPITAIQPGSAGADAGFKEGDVIETVDGNAISDGSSEKGWDPSTLPDYLRAAAVEGRSVEFTVLRRAAEGGGNAVSAPVKISVKPRVPTVFHSALPPNSPMGAPALGIAYRIENTVQAVAAAGPAVTIVKAGDKIVKAKFNAPKPPDGDALESEAMELGPDNPSWPAVITQIQLTPAGTTAEFTIEREGVAKPIDVTVEPVKAEGVYVAERGFNFEPLELIRTAPTFAEQVRYGWDETVEALTMVVRFLKKLGTQVPITMLGGPGTIAAAAGGAASQGLSSLLIFLTMLSANLAVVNFLPIPLLDGGHMVFLAYEGLRGRPANERVVVALHTVGFVFIISLMVFVIGLDIQRWL